MSFNKSPQMNQDISTKESSPTPSFTHFVFSNKKNRRFLLIATAVTLFQFIVFKLLYPYPDFFSDSYSYVYAASANLNINIWPIGYSKFLILFHWFTHSDTALIAFQYFFLELSSIYFFFSILYFYNPGKTTTNVLFVFLFCNPLFLYLSNYINSDPLFAAISLLWITELLWIIQFPSFKQVFIQAVLLFFAFTIRNNAYYYPLVAIFAFAFSHHKLWTKFAGSIAGFILIIPFILYSRNEAYELTGTKQYSLFTGWQLANNALYIYDQVKVDSTKWPDQQTKELDKISREFIRTIPRKSEYRDYLNYYVGNYFIRQPEAPLKQYLWSHYEVTDDYTQVITWGKCSVVYAEFGTSIIKKNPLAFIQYFMLPNAKNYFLPPLEKLEIYNLGLDDVPVVVQDWFDYKTPNVWAASKTIQAKILFILPPLFLVINLFFLGSLAWFLAKKYYLKATSAFNATLSLNTIFLLCNFGFSVFATINVFRYQFFPMILCTISLLLISELLDKKQIRTRSIIKSGNEVKKEIELI